MSLTCAAIVGAITTALRADAAIIAKCQDWYGTDPAVYGSATGNMGPETEIFPALTVAFWGKEAGDDQPVKTWDLSIMCEVSDDSTAAGGDIANLDYVGADRVEELLDLALAVVRGISAELFISNISYSFEPIEFFPIFVGVLAFTVSFPSVMGGYEPSL